MTFDSDKDQLSVTAPTHILDPEVDALLEELQRPSVISIHGDSGTGKSLIAAQLAVSYLRVGKSVNVLLLGRGGQAAQFLNQTMGIGLDLYSHLRTSRLWLFEESPLPYHELIHRVLVAPVSDLFLIDRVEMVLNAPVADVEPGLAWLLLTLGSSSILVTNSDVGKERSFSDVQIDLSRTGRDVERAHADSIMYVHIGTTSITRCLRVAATGLELWAT
jgi:PhoH-like protein